MTDTDPDPPDLPDPPEPPDPGPPTAQPASAFDARPIQIDASREVKAQVFRGSVDIAPTVGSAVTRAGQAETVGAGGRAAVAGQHNWVPIGPRNVGGRVRALAIDPSDASVMYAAPASGGVYKSRDAGESWFPLWHDEPSLSMGALAVSPSSHLVVWAATGETSAGGGETIPATGIWRSTDGGATWTNPPAARAQLGEARTHALAAHPTNDQICWAATDQGVFRTLDGGANWTRFACPRPYSDVAILTIGGNDRVFLAMSGSLHRNGPPATDHPVIVRLDDAAAADAAVAAILPSTVPALTPPPTAPAAFAAAFNAATPLAANTAFLPAIAAGTALPQDGKLAVFAPTGAFANARLFVVYARDDRTLLGAFRCADPDRRNGAGANTMQFTALAAHPRFADETQGEYNLALAVSPVNPNHLALAMVELYVNRSADATPSTAAHWLRGQMGDLYHVDRGHHSDHHALVFHARPPAPFDQGVGTGATWLWDANDGGISVSGSWEAATQGYPNTEARLPLPTGVPTWRKRSHGISAAQMYDLTQHPRLSSVLGCGFQDNGVYVSTGGATWDLVLTADGGFIAFDPDDPYRLLSTWQGGITESRFPGRLRLSSPLLRDGVINGLWPRELTDGFRGSDRAVFTAETVFHPTQSGRVLHSRRNRLYGTRPTTGDRWQVEPLGPGVELIHEPRAAAATAASIEIHDTPGAMALGLVPQVNGVRRAEDTRLGARVRTLLTQPFAIPNGQRLRITVHNDVAGAAPDTFDIVLTVGADLPASATSAQLAAYITAKSGGRITALPVLCTGSDLVTIVTRQTGRANSITVGGSAMAKFVNSQARTSVGADAAAAAGASALPAVAFLRIPRGQVDLSGTTLDVGRNGTAVHHIAFAAGSVLGAHDLAARIRNELAADNVLVTTANLSWGVRLTATAAGGRANLTGTGTAGMIMQPPAPARSFAVNGAQFHDFTPPPPAAPPPPPVPPLRLRVRDGTNSTTNIDLTTAVLGTADVSDVTAVELVHALRQRIVAPPANVRVRCDLDLNPRHLADWDFSAEGRITELAFAPSDPRLAWAGDSACRMYRSADGGQTWNEVTPLPPVERLSEVDAIAIHPTTPSTVIAGVYEEGARDAATSAGFLFRTTDDGVTWPHIGQDLHDDAGKLVGVRAVEIDPEHPDTVYAGTDIGVFRSTDGGTHWAPFNEGLPNARVSDLAFDRSGRLLRAGMWGRGVYERHVGTEPVKDVRLYVRSTTMDDGWAQPRPGPDLSATQAVALPLDRSPDIKHTLLDPVRGVVIDGVEFDEDIADEPVRVGFSFVSVQVNNRGAMSTSSARVALLWSFADDGPPELPATLWDALAAAPLTRNATFGTWTVIGDQTVPDPQAVDHHIVAPGAPRVVVFGRTPDRLEWVANVEEHRRVGFLALARSTEDPLPRGPASVLSLVQSEAKAAYRECAVVPAASDDRIVLRATTPSGMTVAAPGAGLRNAANGAAPFGLAAVAAPATIVELPTAGDFNLGGGNPFAFRLQIVHNATVRFEAGDPAFRNIGRAFADEVAMVINRSLIDAGLPVRATSADFPGFGSDAMVITPVGEAVVRIVTPSTAAGLLGLATNTDASAATGGTIETPFASRGPWNLTPPAGVARTLQFRVTVVSDVQFPASTPEIPDLAHATARQVRAAIDRQCRLAGLRVVAEPRSTRLSVRGSATEPTVARVVTGSFALGDLAVSPVALADAPARAALFDVVTAHGTDALSAGGLNRLYLRSANVGNVDLANVRHRLYEIDVAASPLTFDRRGSEVTEPRAAGASGIAQIEWDVPATPGGTRLFVLAVADTAADAFDPATVRSFADLDELATFCARQPNIAIRELTVA